MNSDLDPPGVFWETLQGGFAKQIIRSHYLDLDFVDLAELEKKFRNSLFFLVCYQQSIINVVGFSFFPQFLAVMDFHTSE